MNTMELEGIKIISTSSVEAPSHVIDDSPRKIHLIPSDLVFLTIEMNQKGLLFQNPINAKDQIQYLLKHSLSSTLAFFPPLAGRLVIQEHEEHNTASSYILCNNKGALFVHAVAHNTSVADILKPHNNNNNYVPPIVHSLFPLNGVKNYEATSQPLLAIQVTELVDGIFIGCTINHVASDGKSFWHFINSGAEISRGSHKPTKLPSLQRWFMDGVDPPITFPFTNEDKQHTQNFKPQPPPERIFHFTKEKIAQLKSKANAEASTNKISSLQALLTHVWRSVIRTKQVDNEKEIYYTLMVDIRGRIVPPLPECYFGNALQAGIVTMKVEELLEGGLGKGAWEMHKVIASNSDEKVKSHYESWVRTPILLKRGPSCGIMALATSSSPRFNVYGNDFGWGKPVAVRSGGSNKRNGSITVFAGAEEGSVDLEVCLSYEIFRAMENDPEFMDAISN